MEKINVAELLKDCPKGMELDCTMFDNIFLERVNEDVTYPISIRIGEIDVRHVTKEGCWNIHPNARCVIFPKGKTTWEGFQRPFKDGDILSCQFTGFRNRTIYIYKHHHHAMNTSYYVALGGDLDFKVSRKTCALNGNNITARLATEEEKAKLFQAIKANGYKWNSETKTLEKIGYQYPKTYEECCEVFEDNFLNVICLSDDEKDLFYNIIKIKRCRDAYWRIYGEQMGLGKPWEPDFLDDEQLKFCIYKSHNNILPGVVCKTDEFLVFPTEEMRDAFDENFKELINKCKELL